MSFNEKVIIKRKITIGDIFVLLFLFICSYSFTDGIFNNDTKTSTWVFVFGAILFSIMFILLFLFCTFKRPYMKITPEGVYTRLPKGFGYGKEKFYTWEKIELNINQDLLVNGMIDEIAEVDDEFIKNYIEISKQYMKNIDKYRSNLIVTDIRLGLEE